MTKPSLDIYANPGPTYAVMQISSGRILAKLRTVSNQKRKSSRHPPYFHIFEKPLCALTLAQDGGS
jgi:hypothetical protein